MKNHGWIYSIIESIEIFFLFFFQFETFYNPLPNHIKFFFRFVYPRFFFFLFFFLFLQNQNFLFCRAAFTAKFIFLFKDFTNIFLSTLLFTRSFLWISFEMTCFTNRKPSGLMSWKECWSWKPFVWFHLDTFFLSSRPDTVLRVLARMKTPTISMALLIFD